MCVHGCVLVYMCVHGCIRVYMCVHGCICVYMGVYMCIFAYLGGYVSICVYVGLCADHWYHCEQMGMSGSEWYQYILTYIHTYYYIHIYIYILVTATGITEDFDNHYSEATMPRDQKFRQPGFSCIFDP